MEQLIDAVVAHLLDNPSLIHLRAGIYGNEVDRVIGREIPLNIDLGEPSEPDEEIEVTPEDLITPDIRQTQVQSIVIVNRNGGLRFDPVYYPRVEIRCYATPIAEAWDLDHLVNYVMEQSGVVRYEGRKFGSPVGESDGIPDIEDRTGWPYIYRSFLMSVVGPTIS